MTEEGQHQEKNLEIPSTLIPVYKLMKNIKPLDQMFVYNNL